MSKSKLVVFISEGLRLSIFELKIISATPSILILYIFDVMFFDIVKEKRLYFGSSRI
jgi:hypothetical protein